jgi:hypothetical protein
MLSCTRCRRWGDRHMGELSRVVRSARPEAYRHAIVRQAATVCFPSSRFEREGYKTEDRAMEGLGRRDMAFLACLGTYFGMCISCCVLLVWGVLRKRVSQ